MKKLFMLFAVLSFVGLSTVNAQTCTKSASASKSCCAATVAKAASMDDSIEKRVCETSGKVSYVRKEVCSTSGKTSYTNVEYNADTKKFVNVSPTHNALFCKVVVGAPLAPLLGKPQSLNPRPLHAGQTWFALNGP